MIETDRLVLRRWSDDDVAPFHAMGMDMEVMRYLGEPMSIDNCRATVAWMNAHVDRTGSCFWAVERRADAAFIGFCGIKEGARGTPIAGQPEIGWRLARAAWGQGFAREGACACIDRAFTGEGTDYIVAITVPANERSWGLMERLGMRRVEHGDFDHPAMPDDSPLKRHLTYRIDRLA